MADTVRYLLEEMVPELEALEQRGYFSRAEIRAIVQRRQNFEYALKRMAAVKEDYLRYIAYESQLDELREARRSSRAISGKRGLAEWCITRRIHFVYERATRKFRGDLDLWSRWLRFCATSRSSRQMSRVLTKALQLHSHSAALWAYAAAWELEHNLNATAARALMQRGLRVCGHVPGLWHEYFRMELLYALRLRERRRVLGIMDDEHMQAGDAEAGVAEDAPEEEGATTDESAAAVAAVLNGAVAGVVYKSAIAAFPDSLPFRAKFLELLRPYDFPGRAALEEAVYASVACDFGGSPLAWDLRARRHVMALAPGAPPAARRAAIEAAVGVFEEGLREAPSSEMAALLLAFLQQQVRELQAEIESVDGEAGSSSQQQRAAEATAVVEWVRQRAQRAYDEAGAARLLTEALRLENIAFLLHHGEVDAALMAARQAVQSLPQSAALWQQLLVLEAVGAAEQLAGGGSKTGQHQGQQGGNGLNHHSSSGRSSSDDEEEDGVVILRPAMAVPGTAAAVMRHSRAPAQRRLEDCALQAVQAVDAGHAVPLWLTAVSVLCSCCCSLHGLSQQLLEVAMRQPKGPVEGGLGAVAAALLNTLCQAGGIDAARSLYRALLPLPPLGGDFFRCLLQLEMEQEAAEKTAAAPTTSAAGAHHERSSAGARNGAALPASRLRDFFEAATDAYGAEDVQLWLLYCEWQASRGTAGDAAGVYWRACKALRQPEAFKAAHLLRFKLGPGKVA